MHPDKLREEVAKQYQLVLYRQYSEKQAAAVLGKDIGTLKRWRAKGIIPHIRLGDSVRYFGFQLVDVLIRGTRDDGEAEVEVINPKSNGGGACQSMISESTGSGTTGSADEQKVPRTTDVGSTVDPSVALRLARQSLKSPGNA